MKRLSVLLALVVLAAFACRGGSGGGGETPTPTATPTGSPTPVIGSVSVTALDGTSVPQPGVDVFVQSSAGALQQSLVTNSAGVAVAQNVLAGSMVTVARPGLNPNEVTVQTITGVIPGDAITVTPPTLIDNPTNLGSMTVNLPTIAGAAFYEVETVCGSSSNATPTVSLAVTSDCVTVAGRFDLIALAFDATGNVTNYASMTNVLFANAGSVNVPAWTAAATLAASFIDAPAGTTSVSWIASALDANGSILLASPAVLSPGPYDFSVPSAPLNVFANHEQSAFIRFPAVGSNAPYSSITWVGNGAIDTDLAANALPAIQSATLDTSSGFTRPSLLVVTSAGVLADATQILESWTSASHTISWSAFGPGNARTFRYPELPAAYQIAPGDNLGHPAVLLIESTVWPGYDAYRAAPVTAPPYIPVVAGRHRLSVFVFNPG
ncbi:MAG TPA: carboxypeptidase-like regulatory domain-containing protein [bacterium]|nr:carboxypeptidase-like regulatory domain-containing protein [bacterium]